MNSNMFESIKETMIMAICFAAAFASIYWFGSLCVATFGEGVSTTITALICGFAIALVWFEVFKKLDQKFVQYVD